jgi:hypothetical protein
MLASFKSSFKVKSRGTLNLELQPRLLQDIQHYICQAFGVRRIAACGSLRAPRAPNDGGAPFAAAGGASKPRRRHAIVCALHQFYAAVHQDVRLTRTVLGRRGGSVRRARGARKWPAQAAYI